MISFDDIPWSVHKSSAGGPVAVASLGDAAPGTSGALLSQILGHHTSDAGVDALVAELTGGDTTAFNNAGLFTYGPGGGALRLRRGSVVPGTGGARVIFIDTDPAINSSNAILVGAILRAPGGPDTGAILLSTSAGVSPVARTGDPVPGLAGVTMDFLLPNSAALNDAGDIAFVANLSGGSDDYGLFIKPAGQPLQLVLRTGDQIAVNGAPRTISGSGARLRFAKESLNNARQLAFDARFTDGGQGVFLATPDGDNDGVVDTADICPGTIIPEAAPTSGSLGNNRYALTLPGVTTFSHGAAGNAEYTTADTRGCSCTQIVDRLYLGNGHRKFGCARGVMDAWINGLPPL